MPTSPFSLISRLRLTQSTTPKKSWDTHFDSRFARRALTAELKRLHLIALVQTYLETMSALGAETFLMHGSLLGWWWNQKIMPWDSDVDVSISQPTLNYLADYYNMTVHRYQLPFDPDDPNSLTSASSASSSSSSPSSFSDDNTHSLGPSRDYLLDINPHCRNASTADRYNVIDARWIDVATGLYIDITTLRPHDDVAGVTATANNASTSAPTGDADDDRLLSIKDGHAYATTDIYPLRDSLFEGTPCRLSLIHI